MSTEKQRKNKLPVLCWQGLTALRKVGFCGQLFVTDWLDSLEPITLSQSLVIGGTLTSLWPKWLSGLCVGLCLSVALKVENVDETELPLIRGCRKQSHLLICLWWLGLWAYFIQTGLIKDHDYIITFLTKKRMSILLWLRHGLVQKASSKRVWIWTSVYSNYV